VLLLGRSRRVTRRTVRMSIAPQAERVYGPDLSRERTLIVARNSRDISAQVSLTEF